MSIGSGVQVVYEMTRLWLVTLADEPGTGLDVNAASAREAAELGVEHWLNGGQWAGEDPPREIDVVVRAERTFRIRVSVDWRPVFFARLLQAPE